MLLLLWIINALFIKVSYGNLEDEVRDLTENFFANLEADPFLTQENYTENVINFINRQTENYVALIKNKYGIKQHGLNRRSAEFNSKYIEENDDTYIFEDFTPLDIPIIENAYDVAFLEQNGSFYAIVLEKNSVDEILFYKQNGLEYDFIFKKSIPTCKKLITYSNSAEIFIIVAHVDNAFTIYSIVNNTFRRIQKLDAIFSSDITIWENTNGLFLAIAREKNNTNLKTKSPIYKWLGQHFDLIDEITTFGVKSISAYTVGSLDFLAVANFQQDDGQTDIYSEIFKYNINNEKYESYQKISTHGGNDMQFFSLRTDGLNEVYLVVANSVNEGGVTKSNFPGSIIYKYVDKYFIPFDSIASHAEKWLPINGHSGEFLLLSFSKVEGIRTYIYDGWRFLEKKLAQGEEIFGTGVTKVSFQKDIKNLTVGISNENFDNGQISLYKLNFSRQHGLKTFQKDMLKWCRNALEQIEYDSQAKTNNILQSPSKEFQKHGEINKNGTARHKNHIDEEVLNEVTGDDFERIERLNNKLDRQIEEATQLREDIKNFIPNIGPVNIDGDVIAENIIFDADDVFFDGNFEAETLNGKDLKDLLNLININEDNILDNQMEFDFIKVENQIDPKFINGHDAKNLLHTFDEIKAGDVTIDGTVILEDGLKVGGTINNIRIDQNSVLLKEGNQIFNSDLNLNKAKIQNAQINHLNKLNLNNLPKDENRKIDEIRDLKVGNLTIPGYLNNVDVGTLNKYALKTFGDQQLSKLYQFENLTIHGGIKVQNSLSGKNLTDFILISGGEYDIKADIEFPDSINANKIVVKKRINGIKAENDRLNVLLKDTDDEQHITGHNTFEDVILLKPINLLGKIDSSGFEDMSPTIIIEEDIVENDDYVFNGKVTVEKLLQSRDIKGINSKRSVNDINLKGLELDNKELPYHIDFKQQLNVYNITVDRINNVSPDNLLINGNGKLQTIKGWKKINTDVYITGSTTVIRANNIHIPSFKSNILNTDDDQEIIGKHHIKEVEATSITSDKTTLGNQLWKDVITKKGEQEILGTTIFEKPIKLDYLSANNTQIDGLINDYDLDLLLNDTVTLNTSEINAHKTFKKLEVKNLHVKNGFDLQNFSNILADYERKFQIDQNLVLPDGIRIENLIIDGVLNNMSSEDFNKNWLDVHEAHIFPDEYYYFDTVTVYQNTTILNGAINGIALRDIVENTKKIDENNYFNDVTFNKLVVSVAPLILVDGNIVGLDLDNVVRRSKDEQIISDPKTFLNHVEISGNIEIEGSLNGLDYDELCDFSTPDPTGEEPLKRLIITGNTHFLKGPILQKINDVPIENLYNSIWLSNREANLTGHLQFETMKFENNVTVQGLINGLNLTYLSENYFSKTKDQIIPIHLDFTDGANFFNGVSAPEIQQMGVVNGVNLMEFVRTAILNDIEQVFESTPYMETCRIENLRGDYLVNDLNLPNDLMRYDVKNFVTGPKIIPNLIVDNLVINQNLLVQNVDLLDWISRAVLKSGGSISADVYMHGDVNFDQNLGVKGLVNGMVFDDENIMLLSKDQIITGNKTFYPSTAIRFSNLILKGYLNSINMTELLNNLAYKNEDVSFTSQVNLNENLVTNNLTIDKLYNGVDIEEIMTTLTNTQDLDNYSENYAALLNKTNRVKESLDHQAYFLSHYTIAQDFRISDIHYLNYGGISCIAEINSLDDGRIDLYKWDDSREMFSEYIDNINIKSLKNISFLSLLSFGTDHYLYIEQPNYQGGANKVIGTFMNINNTAHPIDFPTNGTINIQGFAIPDVSEKCFIFSCFDQEINIHCKSDLSIYQKLKTFTSSKISITHFGSTMFIAAIYDETNTEAYIDVWMLDENTKLFNRHQVIYVTAPNSISITSYQNNCYLAITSGHLQDASYEGIVHINKLNATSKQFEFWHDIHISAPIQVEFVILPTKELILYVLSDNIAESLTIYTYEGAFGFKRKHTLNNLRKIKKVKGFNTIDGKHFVAAWSKEGIALIRANFKGYRNSG